MIPQPLHLFSPVWFEPIDTRSQVDRMPGTADAPCVCWPNGETTCLWPYCGWKPTSKEDE